jgi:hypothetical protein
MNCLIDDLLKKMSQKKKQVSVLSRYLRIKHKIKIEESLLLNRAQKIKVA